MNLKDLLDWETVRNFIVSKAEKFFIDFALKKILGSAVGGGLKVWLVKLVAGKLFKEIGEPLLQLAVRKGFLLYDIRQGKILVKKIEDAKREKDAKEYFDNIGNV